MPTSSFLYAELNGAVALVHAYLATTTNELRYLSLGGSAEAVKAILAGGVTQTPITLLTLTPSTGGRTRRQVAGTVTPPDTTALHRIIRRLPCGQTHGVLYPDTSALDAPTRFPLLLPSTDQAQAPARLLRMLDARTALPLHASWAQWIWNALETHDFLAPLCGHGPWIGWDVEHDDPWLHGHVTKGLQAHTLSITPAPSPSSLSPSTP